MARNLKNEAAWAKEKYQRFNFAVSKELGQGLIEHLSASGIKQADWFKSVVERTLAQVDEQILAQVEALIHEARLVKKALAKLEEEIYTKAKGRY